MTQWIARVVHRLRQKRWLHISVIVLRIVIGFAFLPAGLKKVLGEPFTDPTNTGPFHEFLHAFHGTGFFYSFVGAVQLLAAILMMTQRYATVFSQFARPCVSLEVWRGCEHALPSSVWRPLVFCQGVPQVTRPKRSLVHQRFHAYPTV